MKKEKIKSWFKDKYNLAFVAILIFAFAIRLYYFFLTKNQPLWWDEAEYMLKAKNIAFHTPDTGWASLRPPLAPWILSLFFFIGLGEKTIHFSIIILSLANLILIYLLGKELFDKKIAILGVFIYSIIYLDLFYTTRILLNVPELFFGLLIFYLFYMFYVNGKKYFFLFVIVSIFGILLRYTVGIYLIIILIFIVFMRDISPIISEKKFRMFLYFIIALIIIVIISAFFIKINLINSFIEAFKGATLTRSESISSVFFSFILTVPKTIHFFTIFFILGFLIYFYNYFLIIDKIITKKRDPFAMKKTFSLLWVLIPFLIYGLLINHYEDRYILMAFPIVCLLVANGLFFVFDFLKKYNKFIAVLIFFILLIFGSYQIINHSNLIIKAKLTSYDSVKEAGLWLKENTNKSDIIISRSVPQITYYSERATYNFPENENLLDKFIQEKKPKFIIDSIWEKTDPWIRQYISQHNETLTPVMAYYSNLQGQKELTLVVYEVKE